VSDTAVCGGADEFLPQLNSEQQLTLNEICAEACPESFALARVKDLVQAVGGRVEHNLLTGIWCFDLPQQGKDSITLTTQTYSGIARRKFIKDMRCALEGLRIDRNGC
jgi:hypothetical protein